MIVDFVPFFKFSKANMNENARKLVSWNQLQIDITIYRQKQCTQKIESKRATTRTKIQIQSTLHRGQQVVQAFRTVFDSK